MKNLSKILLVLIVSFSSALQAGPLVGGGGGGVHLVAQEKSVIVKIYEISDILLINEEIVSTKDFLPQVDSGNPTTQFINLSQQSLIKNVQLLDGRILNAR